jgi:CHAT domain-containing protein
MMRDVALTDAAPLVTDSAAQRAARETVRRQHETLDVQVNADAWPLGEGAVFVPATAEALLAGITGDDLIVMTVLSEVGAATIIVAAGARELTASDVVWHANFSLDHAEQLLIGSKRVGLERGWLTAYFDNRRNAPVWQSTIRETGRLLWNGLVAEIDVALEARRISAAMRVVIIPPPELALLPWHASWRTVDGQRRYLADDATIRYVPSLAVLAALRRSQAARPPSGAGVRSSLVVADTEQNLPFAAIEGRRVAALARTAPDAALIGEAASFAAVLTGVPGKDLLHFACHGTYLIDDPMWSWLSLGRSGWDIAGTTGNLRLFEIVTTWRGLAASLVTLSACETGIPEVKGVPSESLSLASAWLAAGVLTVVSSFWIVDDFCTLMFMTRFYTEYFDADGANGRSDAATALYEAQRWVRSASAKALAGAVEALIEAPPDISVDDIERLRAKRRAFEAMPADAKPYSEPYWWAGFGVSGL